MNFCFVPEIIEDKVGQQSSIKKSDPTDNGLLIRGCNN